MTRFFQTRQIIFCFSEPFCCFIQTAFRFQQSLELYTGFFFTVNLR